MLAWFRRHAKVLMVVLGSAAMAIFGLGPVFDGLAERSRRGKDPKAEVIATWKGGDITRVQLDDMRQRHYQTQKFLETLFRTAMDKKGDSFRSFAEPIRPLQDGQPDSIDGQLIYRFLMAERAKLEGVVVSDALVDDYLISLSGDAGFSTNDLKAINEKANSTYSSLNIVREHLKLELLAKMMEDYSFTGIPGIRRNQSIPFDPNPTESIELYARTMDQVECEVLPVEVEKFVSQVTTEPSAAELKTLYEEGKFDFPDPTGKEPGFKVGRKVNVQYFVANYETYLENEMNKLTDEDVQKEYDRLVAAENDLVMELIIEADDAIEIKDPPPLLPGDKDPAPAPGDGSKTPGDVAPPPTTEESDKDQPAPPPTENPATTDPATGDKKDGTQPSGTEKTETDPAETEKDKSSQESGESKNKEGDQSLSLNEQNYQFISTVAQEESAKPQTEKQEQPAKTEPAKTEPAKTEPAKTEPAKTEPAKTEPAKTEPEANANSGEKATEPQTEPETTKPGEDPQKPAETPAKPGEPAADSTKKPDPPSDSAGQLEPGAPQDTATPKTNAGADSDQTPEKPKRKPKPLKDVVREVKRAMSDEAAREAMKVSLAQAEVIVMDHFQKMLLYEYDRASKKVDPPAPLDIKEIAKTYNLESNESGLVDQAQLSKETIGSIGIFFQSARQFVQLGQLIFMEFAELKLYEAKPVSDMWGSGASYLYWVSEKAESRIPTLDEARPDVEKFWKQQRAFDLAMAEAESIKAKIAAASPQKMSESFPVRAISTGAFTWFGGNSRFSTPVGVTDPGEKFMQTAFSLGANEVGVAPNETRSTVYVIQAVVPSQPAAVVGTDYLDNQFFLARRIPNEVLIAAQRYGQAASFQWQNQEVEEALEFKYINR